MRKHQFVKVDCLCKKKATQFVCNYCGVVEYRSKDEVTRMSKMQAKCDHANAPEADPQEQFKSMLGGNFNCLSPDYETYNQEKARS